MKTNGILTLIGDASEIQMSICLDSLLSFFCINYLSHESSK